MVLAAMAKSCSHSGTTSPAAVTVHMIPLSVLSRVRPAGVPDRGTEVSLDSVRLLEAVLEEQPGNRPVLRAADCGEERLQPGRELGVVRHGGHVDQLLDAGDGDLAEGRDPAAEGVGEVFDAASGTTRFT